MKSISSIYSFSIFHSIECGLLSKSINMSQLMAKTARPAIQTVARRSIMHGDAMPQAARAQLSKPAVQGFFSYTRNWSRDKHFNLSKAPQKGDTPLYFLLRRLGHAYEVYPLIVLTGFWVVIFSIATATAFTKSEVWLDRSKDQAPWDWTRIRDKYWKMQTVLFDLDGRTHKRLEIMEKLQDEMYEAAKKRGTR